MKKYDFIIAGGGMAGLSLAYYLTSSALRDRSILILERDLKNRNDRTWCFWEKETGPFEPILFQKWDTALFYGPGYTGRLGMGGYRYKMLRGIDFYAFVEEHLAKFPNVERRQATINRIKDTPQGGFVIADDEPYLADYVFDSTFQLSLDQPERHNLLQHFKGWFVETERACFDPAIPTIMDFRAEQHGDCRFVYVLPFDTNRALVEFTLFNDRLLTEAEYEYALRHYLSQHVDTGAYQITDVETGVIPMSDVPTTELPSEHIIRIGTSGGYTKPSTGYTFNRSQRYLRELVDNLASREKPARDVSWFKRRFALYDSIFLNVLENHRYPADALFTRIYARNPGRVFRFLDEDTTLFEEIRLFATMPIGPFLKGLVDVLRRKIISR
ncbi:lycopene cyclase family protein [Spirosoma rhododendri]|uniref:Lycopene cyclase n=1 Tax=Spirosoma rhododendri TaxID=2728024 RepID=A0A7L5DTR0_9BACT|nr:lycopene cyclase family protein [Spirosoma rhododendri]QJD78950.1 lycopene cyclase [Spirosoma rhododendri]